MANGVNKVILIGHLGADPELRYTPSGTPVANLRLATTESWNDKQGQRQERTEWHRVVVWGKLGELCREYLTKGRQVFVEGRLQTRQWDDRDGNRRYTTEILAREVTFLGGGNGGGSRRGPAGQDSTGGSSDGGGYDQGPPPLDEDNLPF